MIIRVRHGRQNPYVMILRTTLEDPELSLKARGLLSFLLAKPDDWRIYISQLGKTLKENRHTIGKIMQELEEAGYCEKKEIRERGRFQYDYTVFEDRYRG